MRNGWLLKWKFMAFLQILSECTNSQQPANCHCKHCIKYYPPTLDYIITILLYVIQYYYIYLTPTLLYDFWKWTTASAIFGRKSSCSWFTFSAKYGKHSSSKDRNILTNTICCNFEGSGWVNDLFLPSRASQSSFCQIW